MNTSTINLDTLFPFELDEFQHQAITALNENKSVVVCAPTGAGKTLIGEYAIYRALACNQRVFYTTPLKALSNQKFRDFQKQFGQDVVGLLTGDASVNRDGQVLVMTTEIFRNMLYGTDLGKTGTSVDDVSAVVLDECHYMNDRQRGTVWEEAIIYCPSSIQLVALSATIANGDQLTDWISQVHGPTVLINSDFRPVPLQFYFSTKKGLFPLLNQSHNKVNPRLKSRHRGGKPHKARQSRECPHFSQVLGQLQQRDMLPAIYFIFSRRNCERAVADLAGVTLVNEAEAAQLKTRIDGFLARNADAARFGHVEPLYRGIAAHHAGILPAWKGLVERLFQAGLVKVVFATETLAAGINMPARTTVISAISKRTNVGHRLLTPSEFLQMAGRAGRRGMDIIGHVSMVQTRFEDAQDVATLALKKANPLVSQFTPTYGMVLNLLQTHNLKQVQALLEKSFSNYLANLKLVPEQQAIAEITTELAKLDVELAAIPFEAFARYQKLKERLKEERRLVKVLKGQSQTRRGKKVRVSLGEKQPGTILYLQGKQVSVQNSETSSPLDPLPGVLFAKIPGQGQSPNLICLSGENHWYVVTAFDVVGFGEKTLPTSLIDSLMPPDTLMLNPGEWCAGNYESEAAAAQIPQIPLVLEPASEVLSQQKRIDEVKGQMDDHPLHQHSNPGKLIKRHQRRVSLRQELSERQVKFRKHQSRHWQDFLNLIDVLQQFSALEEYQPTSLGKAVAAIRGDNELWLGSTLISGALDDLAPQDLAASVCALISETPRADTWTNYAPPQSVIVALSNLENIRHQLLEVQSRYKVELPLWLELRLVGLVEQWVLGVEWSELCENTSLDEGDIVRILRRTIDFLSQIPHISGLPETLITTSREAIYAMERFPVKEDIV